MTAPPDDLVRRALEDAHRREWAFVLSAVVRVTGDLDLAEECAQDAYVAAIGAWSELGVPRRPGAWLTTAARNRALDRLRRDATLRRKLPLLVEPAGDPADPEQAEEEGAVTDDRLRLVFTCCHPALAQEAQAALTLRLVCGLATSEVARAFLVPEPTMAARLTRAKKKIATARIPYRVPDAGELPERLDSVLTTVHLLFTAGHTAAEGPDLERPDVVRRALDLGRTLAALLPDEAEVEGLLALMILGDARRGARKDEGGSFVLLEDQDRGQWDRSAIAEGLALARRAMAAPSPGRFALQAAIAGLHASAPTWESTDWAAVLLLYDALLTRWDSPVVRLNRAAALAFARSPAEALAEVERLAEHPRLAHYPYLAATRADLLRRLSRPAEAASAYRQALLLSRNGVERAYLARRLTEVDPSPRRVGPP